MENQHHHIVYHCFTLRANVSSNRSSLRFALFLFSLSHIVEKDQCNTGTQGNKHRSTFATKKPSSFLQQLMLQFTLVGMMFKRPPSVMMIKGLILILVSLADGESVMTFGRVSQPVSSTDGYGCHTMATPPPRTIIFLEIYVQV